jgi:hypothetical protein
VTAGGDLVAGELRGYRQFDLVDGALLPMVHSEQGAWEAPVHRARCARVPDHRAPVRGCTCGLYAMYRPGSATVSLGAANAVVAARGRCVLGDRGFRAAAARVEAVALPSTVRWSPWAARLARAALAQRYPGARVYGSTRRMLRDFPPDDVGALGIDPPPDRSRGYRAVAALVWATFVVAGYSLVLLPQDAARETAARWWPVLVALVLAWQVAFVWLLTRLMALQQPVGDEKHWDTGPEVVAAGT